MNRKSITKTVNVPTPPNADYLCPGQEHPISRSLHLARMAEFYPACRNCPHHTDTGSLSEKLVERLNEVWTDGRRPAGFQDEGFLGNSPNELSPVMARQAAAAFGLWLQRSHEKPSACRIAVASDERSIMSEYVAAVCEGLRWAVSEVFDIGPSTSAALEFAVAHFALDGGILLGSVNEKPSSICLKFWAPGPHRMLEAPAFQPLDEILQKGLDRPARSFGPQHRLQAESSYLASLVDQFHGLRPLRFVADSTSRPWLTHLEKLLQSTACRLIPCHVLPHEFPQQITADKAHFGIRVTNDGESYALFDEQGRPKNIENILKTFRKPEEKTTIPDALTTLVQFLQLLSRDDRPCSAVLDGT